MLVRGVRQGADAVPGSHDVSGQGQPTWMLMALASAAGQPGGALLSAEGYQVERALAVLAQWMEDAAKRAAS
jgi:hypothetical protein